MSGIFWPGAVVYTVCVGYLGTFFVLSCRPSQSQQLPSSSRPSVLPWLVLSEAASVLREFYHTPVPEPQI